MEINRANPQTIYEWALKYYKHGWNIIPIVKNNKMPALKEWVKYQTQRATEEELKQWFDIENPPNIGIITGKLSQITVVDVEYG
jgi:hypothetical protein